MAVQLPRRFTRAWIERNVPFLSERDVALVIAAMRAKGWTEEQLAERVYPHVKRLPPEVKPPAVQRRRRRPRLSLVQASSLAGIAGSLAGVVALFDPFAGDEPTRNDRPKTETAPGRTPAGDASVLNALRAKIPPVVRGTCSTDTKLRKQFAASSQLSCRLAGADQVVYFKFRTAGALSRAYQPTPRRIGAGPCGKEWNVESGYNTPFSKTDVGSLKCYTHKGTAWVEWTRDDLMIYAYASRRDADRKALFTAWRSAGPTK